MKYVSLIQCLIHRRTKYAKALLVQIVFALRLTVNTNYKATTYLNNLIWG